MELISTAFKAFSVTIVLLSICRIGYGADFAKQALVPARLAVTSLDGSRKFEMRDENLAATVSDAKPSDARVTLQLQPSQKFQTMVGFGFCLTQGSAMVLHQSLGKNERAALLKELFTTSGSGIGISVLRIPIGSSDLSTYPYSYDESDEPDLQLKNFSLGEDLHDLLPVLKEIVALNPKLTLIGSPWSPPTWMKSNRDWKGGQLSKVYNQAYADYFVRYLEAMEQHGIRFYGITVQNEPENEHNVPSLAMSAEEQRVFVRDYLGPTFAKRGRNERIIIYDHNCDHPEYPSQILQDPDAAQFIDGSAFHLYAGEPSAMSVVHDRFPGKSIYFTEQWLSAKGNFGGDLRWHMENVIVGSTQNWAVTALEWNLANNEQIGPHTQGGCDQCLGAVTIDTKLRDASARLEAVKRSASYYAIAHASKFVPPGSVRIGHVLEGSEVDSVKLTVFQKPSGGFAMVGINPHPRAIRVSIENEAAQVGMAVLPASSVVSLAW